MMYGPGVQLGGRYRLDQRIGAGGMGEVWRGTDEVLGRTVAVKLMLPALLDQPGFADRFRGEARTMANLNHPGVVDVYDYHSDAQVAFLVMEYVEGETLSDTLHRVGRLTAARTMSLVAQAADALQAAHDKGIVHRDVKPGNLMVRPDGTLVLTDFGIARSELVGQLTAAGAVLGSASYLSPEQAAGRVATPASDVYALGVVAYQCLTGRRPFEGDNPVEIAMRHIQEAPPALPADISAGARDIVMRALQKEPAGRWPSASHMASAARGAAAGVAVIGGHAPPAVSPPGVPPVSPPGVAPRAAAGGFRPGVAAVAAGAGGPAGPAGPVNYTPPPRPLHLPPPPPSRVAPVRDRPSGLFIVTMVLAVVALLLCAGLGGYVARQLAGGATIEDLFPLLTDVLHIEGPRTT
jgi:serine/threonine-protein kinase